MARKVRKYYTQSQQASLQYTKLCQRVTFFKCDHLMLQNIFGTFLQTTTQKHECTKSFLKSLRTLKIQGKVLFLRIGVLMDQRSDAQFKSGLKTILLFKKGAAVKSFEDVNEFMVKLKLLFKSSCQRKFHHFYDLQILAAYKVQVV